MQMITEVCDYVFVMNFGKVIAQGIPKRWWPTHSSRGLSRKAGSKNATA